MLWAKQRTWGWYLTLLRTPWLCVKLLRFAPGGKLSVQRHMYRSEHWRILSGRGVMVYGDKPENVTWQIQDWFGPNTGSFGKVALKIEGCTIPYTGNKFTFGRSLWHTYVAYDEPVYALEIQWGRKVSESDIERWQG